MSQVEPYAAPVIAPGHSPEDKWRRELHAFQRQLPQLLQTYRHRFVALHNGQVVDSDEVLVPLAARVYAKYGYIPIYMDCVVEPPATPLHVPHYRPLTEP